MRQTIIFTAFTTFAVMVAPASNAAAQIDMSDNWRAVATQSDQAKVANVNRAWQRGLDEARRADPALLRRLGAVARPGAALTNPQPAPGMYRCRTIKLGSRADDSPRLIAYGWFRCHVELTQDGEIWLRKTTGSQRPGGRIYPYTSRHLAFVGTLSLSSGEAEWPDYNEARDRNLPGLFERIGKGHYRLVMPQPEFESELDLLEIRR